jgi:cathepsin C
VSNNDFVNRLNSVQTKWKARAYKFLERKTIGQLISICGGKGSRQHMTERSYFKSVNASGLPLEFDWRNVSGLNYVSKVRDQGDCGSCYAFASMAMNEARWRIWKNKTDSSVTYSVQDILDCSQYSQSCNGGFAYLVSGKYGEDFGLTRESCNPYVGVRNDCKRPSYSSECSEYEYTTNYRYVGGFYGACSEALMRIELVQNGPFVVSFEIHDDFLNYASGVYHHTGLKDQVNFHFDPFELVTHAVLLVGYGSSDTEGDYWIAKNSWGTQWGSDGFFKIRRGTDECHIESAGVAADIHSSSQSM